MQVSNFEIFETTIRDEKLVIIPQGSTLEFSHNQVQIESNHLIRLFNSPELKSVIVDLSQVDYLDSIMISALTRLLQLARQTGGQAVFCNVSDRMQEVLERIKLGTLWPVFDSLDSAVACITLNQQSAVSD